MSRGYAAIGLYSPKTPANVGGIMRAAYCYDAALIVIVGRRYKRQPEDVHKSYRTIPVLHTDHFKVTPMDCVKVAVELCPDAIPLDEFKHPERAFYIFGPEDGSIPTEVLGHCAHRVMVPTRSCMNLAATANVILYDRLVKMKRKAL